MKFAKALVLGCLTTLTTTAAFAQSQAGWVQIRHLGGYVKSHDFVSGRGQQAEDLNNNYWNFYYKFVYNINDLNKTACFAGDENKAMAAIDKTKGFVGDLETPTVQNLRYNQNRDTIQFSIMNRRAEVAVDVNAMVQIEIPRCGNTLIQPTSINEMRDRLDTMGLLATLFGRGETRFVVNHVPAVIHKVNGGDVLVANSKCVVINYTELGRSLKLTTGQELNLRIKTNGNTNWSLILALTDETKGGTVMASCAIPTTSTLQDLEQALDGMFTIKN